MMGRQAGDQSQLFYLFNLEERIPARHLLRRINPIVTRVLADLREKLIVDVEATPARTSDEVAATKTMIERTKQRLTPNRLAADTAYGTGKLLGWLVGAGIAPHIPVWGKGKRNDGTFSRSDFMFGKEKNEYKCPNGKVLRTTGRVDDGRTILYRASKFDCDPCPLKPKCCPNVAWRKVPRDVNEEARDHARALINTPKFEKSRDERKRVEMRFAHLRPIIALNACAYEASPAPATSSSRGQYAEPHDTRQPPLAPQPNEPASA